MRLKKRGASFINKELNVLKIIKDLRDTKILLKSKMLDKETKFEIAHSRQNVINIDIDTAEEKEINHKLDKEDNIHLKKIETKEAVTENLKAKF